MINERVLFDQSLNGILFVITELKKLCTKYLFTNHLLPVMKRNMSTNALIQLGYRRRADLLPSLKVSSPHILGHVMQHP